MKWEGGGGVAQIISEPGSRRMYPRGGQDQPSGKNTCVTQFLTERQSRALIGAQTFSRKCWESVESMDERNRFRFSIVIWCSE